MTRTVPDAFVVKGVSTYYNKDGKPSGQWVKSSLDNERRQELIREAFEAMAEELPRLPPIDKPSDTLKEGAEVAGALLQWGEGLCLPDDLYCPPEYYDHYYN